MADSTLAQTGSAVTLHYAVGSPIVWTNLGPIRSIAGIGQSRPEVDSTTLDSTAVERIGGLPDGKQVTVVFTTATSNHDLIEGFVTAGTPIQLRVVFPTPVTETRYFYMVPLDYDRGSITPGGLMETTLMGRITGSISATALP